MGFLQSKGHEVQGVDHADVDLSDGEATRGALGELVLDAVVHCAGGFRWSKLDEMKSADWDFLLRANLLGTFNMLQAVVPGMRARKHGVIVVIGAQGALKPGAGMGPYAATKAGVHALIQALSEEGKPDGITAHAILPTVLDTPQNRKDMPQANPAEWVTLESVAELALKLIESKTKTSTGPLIPLP